MQGVAKVIVAGRNELIRVGVRSILVRAGGCAIVAEPTTAETTLTVLNRSRPDLLIVTDRLDTGNVMEIVLTARRTSRPPAILVFLGEDEADIFGEFASCLTASASVAELLTTVRCLLRERPDDREAPAVADEPPGGLAGLTPRETQVLGGLTRGLRDRQIASRLGVSTRTVEAHVRRLLLKLGVKNRTEAACRALTEASTDTRQDAEPN